MSNTDLPQRLAQLRTNIRAATPKAAQQPPIDVEIVEDERDDD